jgi:hypothetical protein
LLAHNVDARKVNDMPRGSSPKRERQYEHILSAERERGVPEKRAEATSPSRLSKTDISSQRRAAYRRKHGGSGRTRDQLYEEAKERNIAGRSRMTKAQLQRALR